ncbi:MAG: LysE family translocator [Pseudomonadota bacterium]
MLSFSLAVFLLMATPGPGVLSVAAVGSGFGLRTGLRYMLGLMIGSNIVAAMVFSGAAALVLADPALRLILTLASAGYLLWLAVRLSLAGAQIGFAAADRAPGVFGGLLFQLVNLKAYLVYLALFSGFAFMPESPTQEGAVKFLLINAIWLPLHAGWLGLGIGLRRLAPKPHQQRWINRVMAVALLAAVLLTLWVQPQA